MKQLVVGLLLCGWSMTAFADQEPFFGTEKASAVLNNPGVAVTVAKGVTNVMQPAVEDLYCIRSGKWHLGTSAAILNLKSHDVPLASLRGGYVTDTQMPYAEAQANLPGITSRYLEPHLPSGVKGLLMAGGLDTVWAVIGKYGHVGAFAGYSFDKSEPSGDKPRGGFEVGVAVGGRVNF